MLNFQNCNNPFKKKKRTPHYDNDGDDDICVCAQVHASVWVDNDKKKLQNTIKGWRIISDSAVDRKR